MGQSVNEQAYPFELIKNKTLQFLAKSLPILKSEYETIPKVARYLPANQLLNPTSLQSPLGHGHFYELNRNGDASALSQPPPFLRRRKRSAARQATSITVTEMMPNATLVVSSAHSAHSAGRIGSAPHQSRSAEAFAMITKDGLRPIGPGSRAPAEGLSAGQASVQQASGSSLRAQAAGQGHEAGKAAPLQVRHQQVVEPAEPAEPAASAVARSENNGPPGAQRQSHAAGNGGQFDRISAASWPQTRPQAHQLGNDLAGGQAAARSASGAGHRATANQIQATGTPAPQRNHASASDNKDSPSPQLQARSAPSGDHRQLAGEPDAGQAQARNGAANGRQQSQPLNGGAVWPKSGGSGETAAAGNSISSSGQQHQQQHLKCANVNGLFLHT